MRNPAKRKPVIGLMGGIGSGKSLVARHLARLGCAVIDADALARDALARPEVARILARWWPEAACPPDGRIDRRKVAERVFGVGGEEALHRLEALIHPHVHADRASLHRRYAADPQVRAIVEDCPLLLEAGLDKQCDAVIFVDAPRQVRLARLAVSRGWSDQDLALREKSQASLDRKAARADYIVVNDASEDECFSRIRGVFLQILDRFG